MNRPGRRLGSLLAVTAFASLFVACHPPPGAGAPLPAAVTVTVAAPAVVASSDGVLSAPEKPPWEQLLAVDAVFADEAPSAACPSELTAMLLIPEQDPERRLELAAKASCTASPRGTTLEIALCCPPGLAAPSALRTGDGESCEEAQESYWASRRGVPTGTPPGTVLDFLDEVFTRADFAEDCGLPSDWGMFICAVVRQGTAIGVSVRTTPASLATADCVAAAVRRGAFPLRPGLALAEVSFAPPR